jgi:hypothetical protein
MFRQCLVRFYDAIRGNTGVKLNEEIKGVFDRILAADSMKAAPVITPDSPAPSEKGVFFQSGREPPPESDITDTNQKQTKKKEGGFMDFESRSDPSPAPQFCPGQKVLFRLNGSGKTLRGHVIQIDEMSVKIRAGDNDVTVRRDKGSLEILPADVKKECQTKFRSHAEAQKENKERGR